MSFKLDVEWLINQTCLSKHLPLIEGTTEDSNGTQILHFENWCSEIKNKLHPSISNLKHSKGISIFDLEDHKSSFCPACQNQLVLNRTYTEFYQVESVKVHIEKVNTLHSDAFKVTNALSIAPLLNQIERELHTYLYYYPEKDIVRFLEPKLVEAQTHLKNSLEKVKASKRFEEEIIKKSTLAYVELYKEFKPTIKNSSTYSTYVSFEKEITEKLLNSNLKVIVDATEAFNKERDEDDYDYEYNDFLDFLIRFYELRDKKIVILPEQVFYLLTKNSFLKSEENLFTVISEETGPEVLETFEGLYLDNSLSVTEAYESALNI